MGKSNLNTNKFFMLGNGILAFAVIIVVVIFVYMSMRLQSNQERQRQYTEIYHIQLVNGFKGDTYTIYINDSIIYNDKIINDSLNFSLTRFEEQSALLLVDSETEKLSTIELSERGGNINLVKEDGAIKQVY